MHIDRSSAERILEATYKIIEILTETLEPSHEALITVKPYDRKLIDEAFTFDLKHPDRIGRIRKKKTKKKLIPVGSSVDEITRKEEEESGEEPCHGSETILKEFRAYPHIGDPTFNHDLSFDFTIGYGRVKDDAVAVSGELVVHEPDPGDVFNISIRAEGGKVYTLVDDSPGSEVSKVKLILDHKAIERLRCIPNDNVNHVILHADYIFKGQLIGTVSHIVIIDDQAAYADGVAFIPPVRRVFSDLTRENKVDICVSVRRTDDDGTLQWTIATRHLDEVHTITGEKKATETGVFAKRIQTELREHGFTSVFALGTLESSGKDITDLIPELFWEILGKVKSKTSETPSLLLYTDETRIPWELAYVPADIRNPDQLPFLCCQVNMGRWLLREKIEIPPPTTIEVTRFTAMSQSYGGATGLGFLEYTNDEAKILKNKYAAESVDAKINVLGQLLMDDPEPGHLIHFAIHGISDPTDSAKCALILVNSTDSGTIEVYPTQLAGVREEGNPPRFSFVFLNACQVGATHQILGQAAGFPPHLIRVGTKGFIAPLWSVVGKDAISYAEHFYDKVLGKDTTVSEALTMLRATYEENGSVTPLAYVYYGHPNTKLLNKIQ